jgi:PAS domain S-box-containing protein/putative nucleotidyltransferase with HDIG domain
VGGIFAFNGILFLVSFVVTLGVVVMIIRRRNTQGALPFGIIVLCELVWLVGYILEVIVPDLQTKLLLDYLQYIPALALPTLAVWFVYEFSEAYKRVSPWLIYICALVGISLLILTLNSGFNGLGRPEAVLVVENGIGLLVYPFNFWDYANTVFTYLAFVSCLIFLTLYGLRQPRYFRPQFVAIFLGFLIPLLAFIFPFLSIHIGFQRDPSPFAFALANIFIAMGLFRHRLFELGPIAAETILERMTDAVLTVDRQGRLVDRNPAAQSLAWLGQAVVGSQVIELFQGCAGFPPDLDQPQQAVLECSMLAEATLHIYEITFAPLHDRGGKFSGHMIVLHEITRRKQAENELRRVQADLEKRVAERTVELTQTLGMLSESEEKFRALVEQSSEGFTLINPEGKIVEWNDSRTFVTGIPREKAIGEYVWDVQMTSLPEELRTQERREHLRTLVVQALRGESTALFGREFEVEYHTDKIEKGVLLQSIFPVQVGGRRWLGSVSRDISERKQAERQLRTSVDRLNTLRSIDQAVLSRLELVMTLKFIAQQAQKELKADAVVVVIYDRALREISYRLVQGDLSCEKHGQVGCLAEEVIRKRKAVRYVPCAAPCMGEEGFGSCAATPVKVDGKIRGVLEIFSRDPEECTENDLGYLEALAGQTGIAIDQADLFQRLEQSNQDLKEAYEATITSWAKALEIRDKETRGHTQRVTDLSMELARRLNYPAAQMDDFRHGVILHDIGKMLIPDAILNKPGPLNETEWVTMREHVAYGCQILSTNPYLSKAVDIPACHHEWWNGKGYPQRLHGEAIPLGARIFAVVDVWDALIETRVYRQAWEPQMVIEHIRSLTGEQFDPMVADAFLELIQTRKPNLI